MPAEEQRPDRDALLQASRRADWRFLLPDPALARVACVGVTDRAMLESLRLLGAVPAITEPGTVGDAAGWHPERPTESGYDLVIATGPSTETLGRAAALVRPGGRLYAELPGPSRRTPWPLGAGPRRAVLAAVRALGLDEIQAYWHWPDFASCTEIVPLGDPGVLRLAFRRRGLGPLARPAGFVARLLGATWLAALLPHVSLLARRSSPGAAGDGTGPRPVGNAVLAFLATHRTRLELARHGLGDELSFVLVTPRFRASRHVVFLVAGRRDDRPRLVVKVPRLPDDGAGIAREAAALEALQGARPEGYATAPRVVALERLADRALLVETALVGRPLDPATVRREPSRTLESVLAWLTELPRSDGDATASGWYERLLGVPLQRFAAAFPDGGEEAGLVARTVELVAPLREAAFPLVFEHGDLSHPNLLRLPGGEVGVVDWELAEPRGLPAHDLFFFLAYVAFARRAARTTQQQRAAVREAFHGPGAWAAPSVRRYAERIGLEPSLVGPLQVACWARYATGLLDRLLGEADGVAPGPVAVTKLGPETAAWLRANRYHAIWRDAVAHAGDADRALPLRGRSAGRVR